MAGVPKKVDHQSRRTLIADALVEVAASQGLEAVSLRHVAAAAGVSTGMVQHYFRTRDEMMAFAMAVVRERTEERITAAIAALGADPGPRTLLRTFIAEVLPLDERSRAYGRVALAFLAYAAVRPEAARTLRSDTQTMVDFVAGLLRAGGTAAADPDAAAAGLLAAMEGLGMYLLGGQYDADRALRALDGHLDLLLGPVATPAPGPGR
jgi:AcrR family transcriptional regulator